MKCTCAAASREAWMEAAKVCPHATYFHTPYWYDAIDPRGRRVVIDVRFDDGVSVIVPIARIKRFGGLLTDHFSTPGGNYGGWLCSAELPPERVGHLYKILISNGNLTFRVNPFDPSSRFITEDIDNTVGVNRKNDFTHTLDLTKGIDSLRGGMNRGHKSAMNVAARNGVTVRQAETFNEWERYYALYRSSLERWRARALRTDTVYPLGFFRRIYENRSGHEILWLAFKDEEPLCGALCFYWNRHAVYWHGASSARYFHLKPNNLLFWEIILDAMRKGHAVFDFNPSGGYAGVETFKERFGAERLPTPMITVRSPLRRIIAGLRDGARDMARHKKGVNLS